MTARELFNRVFARIVTAEYFADILTLTYSDGRVIRYKGSYTVWYRLPAMKRCSTGKEGELSDICGYIKFWGNPYPTAHKGKRL